MELFRIEIEIEQFTDQHFENFQLQRFNSCNKEQWCPVIQADSCYFILTSYSQSAKIQSGVMTKIEFFRRIT